MTVVMSRVNGQLTWVALGTIPVLMLVMRWLGPGLGRRASSAQSAGGRLGGRGRAAGGGQSRFDPGLHPEPQAMARFETTVDSALKARWSQHRHEVIYLALVAIIAGHGHRDDRVAGRIAGGRGATLSRKPHRLHRLSGAALRAAEPVDPCGIHGEPVAGGCGRVLKICWSRGGRPESGIPESRRCRCRRVRWVSSLTGCPLGIGTVPRYCGISFRVEPGEAVVGPSGAGKSTLLQLLPRFFDPDAGVIRLGGRDLREFEVRDLRRHIGFVLQESLLLPGTLAENIGLGRDGATRSEIEAGAAECRQFIRNLPEGGYDTRWGWSSPVERRRSSGSALRARFSRTPRCCCR